MKTILELCLIIGVALGLAATGKVEQYKPLRAVHLTKADFGKASVQILFSPSGKLYVAYRVSGKSMTSSILRIGVFDPLTGQEVNTHDYSIPIANFPRVATAFVLSQDGKTLAYAELHAPQVILTIQAATLDPISVSDVNFFGVEDSGPRISALDSDSLLFSSDKLGKKGRMTTTQAVRKLSLRVRNLSQVISDQLVQPDADPEGMQYWHKHIPSSRDFSSIVLTNHGLLGMMGDGSMQLYDKNYKEVAMLHNPTCGFMKANLSFDRLVGVAVCEKTGVDESHFGETLSRDAVTFEVKTLKALATIPMSRLSLKEEGLRRDELWVAAPTPGIWHRNDRVLVAIPNSLDSIDIYSIAKTTPDKADILY